MTVYAVNASHAAAMGFAYVFGAVKGISSTTDERFGATLAPGCKIFSSRQNLFESTQIKRLRIKPLTETLSREERESTAKYVGVEKGYYALASVSSVLLNAARP
jgi:hypothetical protein